MACEIFRILLKHVSDNLLVLFQFTWLYLQVHLHLHHLQKQELYFHHFLFNIQREFFYFGLSSVTIQSLQLIALNPRKSSCSSLLNGQHWLNKDKNLDNLNWSLSLTLRKKCLCSELFWSVFSRIQTEYQSISPYSVRMRKNRDLTNYKYGHFSSSVNE